MDFSAELAPTETAASDARRAVGDHFAGDLDRGRLHDLQVVVGELVANSAEHGPGQPIRLQVGLTAEGDLRGEVRDGGHGRVAIGEMSRNFDQGLGLHIVDALTDRWAVYEGSTHVWFEMRG